MIFVRTSLINVRVACMQFLITIINIIIMNMICLHVCVHVFCVKDNIQF